MSRNSIGPSRRDNVVSVKSVQEVEARTMKPRINYRKIAPDGISALSGLENYVRQCGRRALTRATSESGSKDGRDVSSGSQ